MDSALATNHGQCRGLSAVARPADRKAVSGNPARTFSTVCPIHRNERQSFLRRGSGFPFARKKSKVAMAAALLPTFTIFCGGHRMRLSFRRPASKFFLMAFGNA